MFYNKSYLIIFWMLLLLLCCNTAPILAQPDSIAVRHQLDQSLIYGTRSRISLTSPVPMQSIGGKALQRYNSLSIADAIRFFSGVQLKDYGGVGGLKTINVRSLGSAHTAVFYDGLQLSNAQNGQVDLGRFSIDNIDEIQLYNGQKSSIFQPARGFFFSNSLYLTSKQVIFEGKAKHEAKSVFKTGSFGLFHGSFTWHQKINDKLSFFANAEGQKAHGKYPYRYTNGVYDTIAVRQNGDIKAGRLEAGVFGQINNGTWNIKTYYYNSERGLPGAIVANRYSHFQRQTDQQTFVQGRFQKVFFPKYELLFNFKLNYDYVRYIDPEYQTLTGGLDNRYHQAEYYFSCVQQYKLTSFWDISFASDYAINTLAANLYRFPYPSRSTIMAVLSSQIKLKNFDLQTSILTNFVNEKVREYDQANNQQLISPSISTSFQPFAAEQFRIRFFSKKAFRMPSFNDLYYTFVGNSNLRPEYTTLYNVGFTWLVKPASSFIDLISIQTDAYYNKVTDKIVAIPSSNLFRWTMMNLGSVDIKGIESNFGVDFNLNAKLILKLNTNYTYQKAIDVTNNGTTYGHQIPYTPSHSGTVNVALNWKSWQINYGFIYTGERYSQKANIAANLIQPWYTSDVNLSWLIPKLPHFNRTNIKMTVEINNLYNQYYDVIVNFPMPGRSFRYSINVQF